MTRPAEAARERPIIFSAPMVRAILAGRKTMTRRRARMAPRSLFQVGNGPIPSLWQNVRPGDRLWVRETWGVAPEFDDSFDAVMRGEERPGRLLTRPASEWARWVLYRTDDGLFQRKQRWRSPIHMPRWASRITLEVTATRLERLQEISEDDARAEGMERMRSGRGFYDAKAGHGAVRLGVWHPTARDAFFSLWQDLHGPASWAANPEVVVIEFRRLAQERGAG